MKTPLAVFLLSIALVSPAAARAQQGGGNGTNQHDISAMSAPVETSQSATGQSKPALFWCMYTLNAGTAHAVHYVNDNLIPADSASYQEIRDAWMSYIHKTYPSVVSQERANNGTGCNDVTTDSPRGSQWFVDQTEAKWKASGHTVTHLNWTYTPPPPGTATQTTAGTYVYCTSDIGASPVYFSDIFTIDLPPPAHQHSANNAEQQTVLNKVTSGFLGFIRSKYSYQSNSNYPTGCPTFGGVSDPLSLAQDSKKKLQEQVKASRLPIVETGWTYNASAPSAAVPAGAAATPTEANTPSASTQPALAAPAAASHPAPAHTAAATAAGAAPTSSSPPTASTPAVPAGKAYRCVFNFHQATGAVRYSGGPFVTEASQPDLTAAWKKFIDDTYHPTDPHGRGACVLLQGRPANWDRVVSSWEQNSNQLGVKTTHVNWTSAPSH